MIVVSNYQFGRSNVISSTSGNVTLFWGCTLYMLLYIVCFVY